MAPAEDHRMTMPGAARTFLLSAGKGPRVKDHLDPAPEPTRE